MLLTPEQIFEIKEIIKDYHDAFIINAVGEKALPKELVDKLKEKGLIDPQVNSIQESYLYGQLLAAMEDKATAEMSYQQFKAYVKKNPIPLTTAERGAVQMAVLHAGQYCQGLGNRVSNQTGAMLIEADAQLRARMETDIRTAVAENIVKRETVKQLKTDLGWATRDWTRDWDRIAITEKQTAMQEGVADAMRKEHGAEALVSKLPQPDACKYCIKLHIGPDGHPRIFKLSTLEANGTNVGKKASDWQPVVGTVHPHCQCQLVRVPKGWGYDDEGILMPGAKGGIRYESEQDIARAVHEEDELQKAIQETKITFRSIPITIENPVGSIRHWKTPEGETGSTRFDIAYGYIDGTQGADGDEIDVFIGPDPGAAKVFVIEQCNRDTGTYDEQKCMLGFSNEKEAINAYRRHYDNPDDFIITTESMDLDHFRRWIAATAPMRGEMGKSTAGDVTAPLRLVLPVAERLRKAGKTGGKYIKRVPYTDAKGKRRYRYYYAESAVARDVQAGETIRLGKQLVTVDKVDPDGKVHISMGNRKLALQAKDWSTFVSSFYGEAYFSWAEKRAFQSVNAVLRHVPEKLLGEIAGDTDKERLANLKRRVPEVYDRLQKSFQRAGVNPFRAKQVIGAALERRGWEPKARAAVIGDVITHRNDDFRTAIRAAENLAGGKRVRLAHVAAVTEIAQKYLKPQKPVRTPQKQQKRQAREKPTKAPPADPMAALASQAEQEIAKLSALLEKARGGVAEDAGEALQAALSSTAIQQLALIAKAFPGLADKAVEPARAVLEQVPAVAPASEPKQYGSDTSVFVAGEGGQAKRLSARYKIVEADDAIASHDPRNFNQRKDYPADVQERAYHRDKAEQAKVMRNAQRLSPEFVINTNPDAVNGPPIMSRDGVVLGGNSRTMSMQLAYARHPEKAKEMRDYLVAHAHEAGFSKEDVEQFKNPILVRVVDEGGETKQDKQILVRQMNESFTQAMDPRTMQVAMGRKLTDETITALGEAMQPDETLNAFLATNRAVPFINALTKAGIIDQRNSNQYFMKGTKKLNPDGRTLVSRILVGRTIGDADLLSATKHSIIENIARITPYMAQAKAYGGGYDLADDVKTAVDAYNSLQYRVDTGSMPPLKADMPASMFARLFSQEEMFGEAHPVTQNSRAMGLLEVLIRKPGSTQITNVFKDYAEQAKRNPEGQGGLLGAPKSPTEIFQQVVDKHLKKELVGPKEPKAAPVEETTGGLFRSEFQKSGPFIGPRGGKWADPQHTIPWQEEKKKSPLVGLKLNIKPHEKIGMYAVTYHVVDHKDGRVKISREPGGKYGPWIPEEALSHLKNDLEGKVDLSKHGRPEIDAVVEGKATFLGKGDDGLAFKVGDKVVKVSTPVPYQPENDFYVTPEEAANELKKQVEIGNKLADIKGVQRSEFVRHEDKGFQIKDWVTIPKKFTREQLDQIQDTVIEIHKRGYTINDTIQPGLDKEGNPVLFDIGKAGESDKQYAKDADMDSLSLLYRESGEHFVRRDVDKTKQAWQHFEGMLKLYLETESFDYARKKLDKAAAKREKDIRAKYKGEELEDALDDLEWDKAILESDISEAEKKAGKVEKGLNATIATAHTQTGMGDPSPGPGLGANYAIDTPNKKKPKRKPKVDQEDPVGVRSALKIPKPRAENPIKTTKETYEGFRGIDAKRKYVIDSPVGPEVRTNEIQRNRTQLNEEVRRNQKPGNYVDIRREK